MQNEMPLNTTNKTRPMKMRSLVLRSLATNIETITTNNIFESFMNSNKVFPETTKNINKIQPIDELDEMESQYLCYGKLTCGENRRHLLEQEEKKKRELNKYINVFFS